MTVRPMLDDIELQHVQKIEVDGDQVLVQHGVPALEGDFLQRLGRRGMQITITGVLTGPEAGDGLKNLRDKFRAAEPVSFVADIAAATQVDQVLIEEMGVRELAGKPERFEYAFTLREYIPPPPPEEEPEIETPEPPAEEIDENVGTLIVEVVVEGEPDFDFSTVTVTVEGEEEGGTPLSRTLTDRTESIWTEEEFPPGDYTVRAVVTDQQPMSGSESATVRAGQTEQVTITLRPGQIIAKAFMIHFWFDKAFIEPCMRAVMRQVAEYAGAHTDEKLVIVGHTDESGHDDYNQSLSERRARSAYAYLTFGREQTAAVDEWNELRRQRPTGVRQTVRDTWGPRQYQYMLQDLGYYPGDINGVHNSGDMTDNAVRAFQADHADEGLVVDGDVGDQTWPVLIWSYLAQDTLAVPESQFLPNVKDGCDEGILKWLGCGEKMPVQSTPRGSCSDPAWRPDRRTEFLFVQANTLPCEVPQPYTFDFPSLGAVGTGWCFGPGNPRNRCCFITRDPNETNKWLVQPVDSQTITVRGSIRFDDGTPLANTRYVLIAPDGEFMDGERICKRPDKGTPISGRTDANGEFAYPDKPKPIGVYTLEIEVDFVAKLSEDPSRMCKGNVICKRLDGSSDFDVIVFHIATTFDLQVSGASQIGGASSMNYLAHRATSEYVIVSAVFPIGTCITPRSIIWSGGEEVPGNSLQRRVPRSTIGQSPITATLSATGETKSVEVYVVRVTLDVDADRNGIVGDDEDGKNTWDFGPNNKGAIVLCNNDDDNRLPGTSQIDNTNHVVDGVNDIDDLAPLIIRRSGPLPPGVSLRLSVDNQDRLRVFDSRSESGIAIVGPAPLPDESNPIVNSAATDVQLGMEAIMYPNIGFNGEIRIALILKEGTNELIRDEVLVRVAPWVMASHLNVTEELYVVEDPGNNDSFVAEITAAATAAGIPLRAPAATYGSDIWIQDTMEIGYSQMPLKSISVVLQAHRDRGLQHYARNELLNRDYGYTEESTFSPAVSPPHNTFDSHGNLEVSPPVSVGSTEYKFGRIYYGEGRPTTPFNPDIKGFLEAQLIQKPFDLDTDWLGVGHVDEIISFIPSNVGENFRMLIASTDEAIRILTDLQTAPHGGDLMLFTGKTLAYLQSLVPIGWPPDSYDHFHERSIDDILADGALMADNVTCQTRLNAVQTQLETELGLDPATDIIKIPSLFVQEPGIPMVFAALIPNMVNMLVITRATFAANQLVIPKPFGPVLPLTGEDQLEKNLRDRFISLGYTGSQIHFVDDFDTYHINLGEVHCGTNSKRRPATTPWWEQTDF